MLLKIKDYFQQVHSASDQQVAREFKLDKAALEPMLAQLVRKGYLVRYQQTSSCQSKICCQCSTPPVFYRITQ